ncbi:MAG: isoprenylcysteine carboxylmethyltransferase family protein [Nitrospirales bacterium]|nr:isoprenylcysteine carboxylmethyltransferase family protein [Nitrospirales bacterium]MDR4483428.1 isoprenylcysteine carboxylmethyltransferase family protein [Nitrospirales bacterium]
MQHLCLCTNTLLFYAWQPIGSEIWHIQNPVGQSLLYGLFAAGWGLVLMATFLINHFDLFGVRQVWLYLRKQVDTPLSFKTPVLYQQVRHPLYVDWLLAFWTIPTMTIAHLVFAVLTTIYILIAIQWEEKDLVAFHGETYNDYQKRVPKRIPRFFRGNLTRKSQAARTLAT